MQNHVYDAILDFFPGLCFTKSNPWVTAACDQIFLYVKSSKIPAARNLVYILDVWLESSSPKKKIRPNLQDALRTMQKEAVDEGLPYGP